MEHKDFLKIYIEHGERASAFLDKAILTITTGILGLSTLSDVNNTVTYNCLFLLGIILIFISLVLVLISYLFGIHNNQLGISYFYDKSKSKEINTKIESNNFIINFLRYSYVITTLFGILFLLITILNG